MRKMDTAKWVANQGDGDDVIRGGSSYRLLGLEHTESLVLDMNDVLRGERVQ